MLQLLTPIAATRMTAAADAGSSGWRKILYFSVKTLRREIAKVLTPLKMLHKKTYGTFGTTRSPRSLCDATVLCSAA